MFEDQIKAGSALLDEKLPGWEDRIDLEDLWLGGPCHCIIGQLFSYEFWDEVKKLVPNLHNDESLYDASCEYGFNAYRLSDASIKSTKEAYDQFDQLTEEWKAYIQERRDKQAQMSTIEQVP